jgi:hypothetical protein
MPIEIEGQTFTGFFGRDFDADKLRALSHTGRVQWLRFRFGLVFLAPFKRLRALDSDDCYIWLCVMNLACGAIEALASYEFASDTMTAFARFVEKYFSPDWKQPLGLHDLRPHRAITRPAEHLYRYFRGGIEHSFAIEWGGLRHREEGVPPRRRDDGTLSYLFERLAVANKQSLGIVPREFVDDFYRAMEAFFQTAASWQSGSREREQFDARFEEVFLTCETPNP